MSEMKDKLRSVTVGAPKHFKSQMVKVGDAEFEVKQPTVAARAAILKAAKAQGGDADKIEIGALQVEAVMRCTFVPGTSERVFEDADRDSLMQQPAGSFVDDLAAVALDLLNVDAKVVEKN